VLEQQLKLQLQLSQVQHDELQKQQCLLQSQQLLYLEGSNSYDRNQL
jgi:hypothetical protein